jgi:glycosyltransferase involved in cell wall biosynthesis
MRSESSTFFYVKSGSGEAYSFFVPQNFTGSIFMEKKKLLIYAHYYYPDVASTGQILQDQAEGMSDEFDVTVICTVPSYSGRIEGNYKTQKYYLENINGVRVIRVRVPEFTKTQKISRIRNIVAYFFGAIGASRKAGKQDYIFTISQPPILGGLLGVFGKWQKHAKMIYCIQDFNPEQVMAVNYSKNKLVLKAMLMADKFSCRHSNLVITVGRDLIETLVNRFSGKKVPQYTMINNWIDEKEIYPLEVGNERVENFRRQYHLKDKFVIMYSGNMGLYYDLENLLKVIERFQPGTKTEDGREVVFAFVGAGSVLDKLVQYKKEHHMENVVFIPYQDKKDLNYSLNAGDVQLVVNSKGIKGVSCPSKFYGVIAAGKAVLGVLEQDAEVQMLMEEIGCGLVCEPGEYDKIEENIRWFIKNAGNKNVLEMGQRGRQYLMEHLTKDVSIHKYKEAIKAL